MSELSLNIFQDTELIAILLVCLLAVIAINIIFHFIHIKHEDEARQIPPALPFVKQSRHFKKYSKKDWFILVTIMVLYTIVSFWNLGSTSFPTTTWQPSSPDGTQDVIFELTDQTSISAIYTIYGEGDNNSNTTSLQLGNDGMQIYGSNDGSTWESIVTIEKTSIYEYKINEGSWDYHYIKITNKTKNDTLTEIGFLSSDKENFLPVSVYQDDYADSAYPAALLIDEQDKLVASPTYYDQAYFDEIYHPRNAWEIANGQTMYASVHPLLGTNIMALSIKIFGMNPFAWRLPGAVCGVLILPVLYGIIKLMFKKTNLAAIGTILCAADFMHLTTSRIGTLEPYSILFILLMFYFMIKYFYTSFYDTSLKKTLKTLLFCGIFMGIAISTKWTACYSAVGLAILLFTNLFQRMREYFKAKKLLEKEPETLSGEQTREAICIKDFFWKKFWITILSCFVFFIFIPIAIYCLSYLPDMVWRGDTWSIANVWKQCVYMYQYHTNLTATHPYQSTWYMWLVDARPIWYSFTTDINGIKHSISCFSNPLLTWAGLPAVIYVIIDFWKKKGRKAWIILVGYMTALLPWVLLVNRCVFSYHFYPTSFFVILAIVYCCDKLLQKKSGRIAVGIFLSAYVILFIAFLPATAGFGTSLSYIKSMEWFGSWYFG